MMEHEQLAKGTAPPVGWGQGEYISPDIKDRPSLLLHMKLMGVDTRGEEWHPLEDHREVEGDHPGVGQEEEEAIMTPMMVKMTKQKTTNQSHPLENGGEG